MSSHLLNDDKSRHAVRGACGVDALHDCTTLLDQFPPRRDDFV